MRTMLALVSALYFSVLPAHAAEPLAPLISTVNTDFGRPAVTTPQLFGSYENEFGDPTKIIRKTGILKASVDDIKATRFSAIPLPMDYRTATNRYHGWLAMLLESATKRPTDQLAMVNGYVNRQPYVAERDGDVWQQPFDFFIRSGDCEDYAIAKYTSLRWLGFHRDRLRVVVGRNTKTGEYHAVTALYLPQDVMILDNRTPKILSQAEVKDFRPLYSFNEHSLWFHWYQGETPPAVFRQFEGYSVGGR